MTTEEFVAFGQDADHWIYPSSNWNDVYAANEQILNQFVSVANRSVFDYQGQGSNAWFEQRFAEYDVVLNDFCLVSGTVESTLPANRRLWLRNVFTEPVGTLGICEDPAAPLEPSGNAAWSDCDFEHDDQHEDIQDESTQDDTQEENIHDDTQEDEEDHSGHDHAEGEHVDEDTGMVGVDSEEDSGAFTVAPFYAFAASLATLFL